MAPASTDATNTRAIEIGVRLAPTVMRSPSLCLPTTKGKREMGVDLDVRTKVSALEGWARFRQGRLRRPLLLVFFKVLQDLKKPCGKRWHER